MCGSHCTNTGMCATSGKEDHEDYDGFCTQLFSPLRSVYIRMCVCGDAYIRLKAGHFAGLSAAPGMSATVCIVCECQSVCVSPH